MKKVLFLLLLICAACTGLQVQPAVPANEFPTQKQPASCSELWCEYVAMDSFCRNPGVSYRNSQRQYACAFVDEYEEICSE